MLCQNCQVELDDSASLCGEFSQAQQQPNEIGLLGFSSKITDPAFAAYKNKSVIWSVLFSAILFIIAVIGMPIYGNISGELEWPTSLFYGLGIGGMFIVIALLQTAKKALDKTWDGEVIYKDAYMIRERSNNGQRHSHNIYELKIKKDSGGTKKHKWRDTPGLYGYYNVGDKVRHHKGFSYYEKYDKSGDAQILCAACLSIQPVDGDNCSRCKCPLLK